MSQHVLPKRTYYAVFLALVVLTVVTVAAAFRDFGAMNDALALSIAVAKAVLVILFFMHVKYGTRLTWIFVASGFLWLALLLGLTAADYVSRGWQEVPQSWEGIGDGSS